MIPSNNHIDNHQLKNFLIENHITNTEYIANSKYPDIIEKVDYISNVIIDSSVQWLDAENQKKLNRNYELRLKKQLSKQAKKELALNKRNSSFWNWEDEI